MPVGMFRPPGGSVIPCAAAYCVASGRRPGVGVGDRDRAEDGGAADDADGDLGPHRPDRESVAAPPAPAGTERVDDRDAGEAADDPAGHLAERARRAAAEQPEGRVQRGDRLALRVPEDEAAPDQQAAEGDDERRDAAVGDDEALEPPMSAPRARPISERDDPGVGLVEAEAEGLRDPDSAWTMAIV